MEVDDRRVIIRNKLFIESELEGLWLVATPKAVEI